MTDLTRTGSDRSWTDVDDDCVRACRTLAADAVEQVGNGHPGTAISLAPVAYALFQKVMRHDPSDPTWVGRDRFVLSCGHTSLTLYCQLFLAGYGLEMEDLKALRTWDAKTPGHPEYGHTAGVEMTTGPLGQGLASAVGMAMAARRERALYDPQAEPGQSPFDHRIYVLASDGDIQEGITAEASSLAGHQRLGNLIVLFDDNRISIENDTAVAISENTTARYESYGWHTQVVDWTASGEYREDIPALLDALDAAAAETDRPSFISLRTIIGWPTPGKQNTGGIHGSKLGSEALTGLKEALGVDPAQKFHISPDSLAHGRAHSERTCAIRAAWDTAFASWRTANPGAAQLLDRLTNRALPPGWEDALPTFTAGDSVPTRSASGKVLAALADQLPELWGGSADLAGSNNTTMPGQPSFLPTDRVPEGVAGGPGGRTVHFGIREHAMGAILNGIALHGGTRPYAGTFLVFSDYLRPSVRLAALMKLPVIHVWTHDSIGLGEDGPTHQPVEHLAALRAIPGFDVVRPADATETVACWQRILETPNRPAGLCLTRQGVPVIDRQVCTRASAAARGGYVLRDVGHVPQVLLIATGSEVQLALAAQEQLATEQVASRVVSMPCQEWFDEQPQSYQEEVLPPHIRARVSVEAAHSMGWHRFVGDHGRIVGLDHYGASADFTRLFAEFGITTEAVCDAARWSLASLD